MPAVWKKWKEMGDDDPKLYAMLEVGEPLVHMIIWLSKRRQHLMVVGPYAFLLQYSALLLWHVLSVPSLCRMQRKHTLAVYVLLLIWLNFTKFGANLFWITRFASSNWASNLFRPIRSLTLIGNRTLRVLASIISFARENCVDVLCNCGWTSILQQHHHGLFRYAIRIDGGSKVKRWELGCELEHSDAGVPMH